MVIPCGPVVQCSFEFHRRRHQQSIRRLSQDANLLAWRLAVLHWAAWTFWNPAWFMAPRNPWAVRRVKLTISCNWSRAQKSAGRLELPGAEDRTSPGGGRPFGGEVGARFGYIARRDNVSLRRDRAISGADTSIAAASSRGKASVMSSQDTQAHWWRLADSCLSIL
jgi:hypothetical protein